MKNFQLSLGIDLLACMFCFPISDHVMLLEGIVSFLMSSYARANVRITNEKNKRQIPMRASHGRKWKKKMYKLKRSINGKQYLEYIEDE